MLPHISLAPLLRTILPALLVPALLALAAAPAPGQGPEQNPMLLDSPREPVAALDFSGMTLAGNPIRLSEYQGQVVLINFWATWCVPCLLEMPAMDRLNKRMAGRPFKLLAVNQGEALEQVRRFAQGHRYSFDLVLDPIGEIGSSYGANRLPMTYIVDKQGFVIRRAVGPRKWDGEAALQLFEALLSAPASSSAATSAR